MYNILLYLYLFIFVYISFIINSSNGIIVEFPQSNKSGNESTIIVYPSFTTDIYCSFQIPILFIRESHDPPLLDIVASTNLGLLETISMNDSNYYVLYSYNVESPSSLAHEIYLTSSSSVFSVSVNFTIVCEEFKTSLEYKIINSGTFYNKLAFTIQISSLEVDKDISLILNGPTEYTSKYLGNKTFFISFKYNSGSFFENQIITLKLIVGSVSQTIYDIQVPSPFKLNNGDLSFNSINLYPSDNKPYSIYYPPTLEFISTSFKNSYFFTISDISLPSSEPFLVSGTSINGEGRYLKLFKSSTTPTAFNINYNALDYPNNSTIYQSQPFSPYEPPILPSITNLIYQLDTTYYYFKSDISTPLFSNFPVYFGVPLRSYSYPFGFYSVLNNNLEYSFISAESKNNKNLTISQSYGLNKDSLSRQEFSLEDPTVPSFTKVEIHSYQAVLIPNNRILLKFTIYCPQVNIRSLTLYDSDGQVFDIFPFHLISTNYNFNSDEVKSIEVNIPRISISKFVFLNYYYQDSIYYTGLNYYYLVSGKFINLKNVQNLDSDSLINFNYLNGLNSVSFQFNDLKVSNIRVSNKMYIKLNNYPIDRELRVTFIWSDYVDNEKKDTVYSIYNSTSKQFEFEFNIPKNIKSGNVSYVIGLDSLDKLNYYSYSLSQDYQLRIVESKNIDLLGPIITDIQTISSGYGWEISIQDEANGYKNGYIIVSGSIDRTERKFYINADNRISGDQYNGRYSISINVSCLTQNQTIIYAYFEDSEGYSTEFKYSEINNIASTYKLYNSQQYLSSLQFVATSTCNTPDNQKPVLNDFTISPSHVLYNNSVEQRTVTFSYIVYHPDGISNEFVPMVVASVFDYKFLNSSNTKMISSNETFAQFETVMVFTPYFGLLGEISISVYGIVTKRGIVAGYISSKTITTSYGLNLIVISDSSKLSSTGLGGVWVYGQYLNFATDFKIQYNDNSDGYISIKATNISGSAAFIPNIRATNKPIQIIAGYDKGYSEAFTIYPVIFDLIDQGSPSNNNPLCKGSPLCGGSSHGSCYTTGCKCILPWVGEDCLSQTIVVPQPSINETNPSTNITIGNDIQFTSIISIVGIRELSVSSKEENKYIFEQWEYKLLKNDSNGIKYNYYTTIKKQNIIVSNISATLEWYENSTTVYFANNEIKLNPSTIKYTIEISNYPFSSKLNTLELIFKASIQSINSNSCSDKRSTLQDNLNTFSLQIDNHSFYGRFAQRGIVDDETIVTVSNILLDSSKIGLPNDNNNQNSQAYIGVTIPYFNYKVIYDPDFSVILNSYTTSCKGNSGLTTSQLAGIIIGSIAFFIIVIIFIVAIIYKSPGCLNFKIFFYKIFKKSKL